MVAFFFNFINITVLLNQAISNWIKNPSDCFSISIVLYLIG